MFGFDLKTKNINLFVGRNFFLFKGNRSQICPQVSYVISNGLQAGEIFWTLARNKISPAVYAPKRVVKVSERRDTPNDSDPFYMTMKKFMPKPLQKLRIIKSMQ